MDACSFGGGQLNGTRHPGFDRGALARHRRDLSTVSKASGFGPVLDAGSSARPIANQAAEETDSDDEWKIADHPKIIVRTG
jgi:hypothetical protein